MAKPTNINLLYNIRVFYQNKSRRFYFLLLFFNAFFNTAQVNLVLNPSFEKLDSCPSSEGQINRATYWDNLDNLSSPGCWALLMNTCCTNPISCGINAYVNGGFVYQFPRTGNSYCYSENFSPSPPPIGYTDLRQYPIGRLSSILISGKNYCGKLYVNLDNISPYKINQFGMYFDDGTVMGKQNFECRTVLNVIPQVKNNPSIILGDTLNWMKIEGVFVANGTETRVTFGNFVNDAGTIGIATGFQTAFIPAMYNTDDLSLIALEITAYAGNDATLCVGDSLHLGRPQEVGLECLWYELGNSTAFASTSDIWFKPTQAGIYNLVQRMDNCAITWDTVHLTVLDPCPPEALEVPNVFTPNGDGVNDVWQFALPKGCTLSGVGIYNRWGNEILNDKLEITNSTSNSYNSKLINWDGRTTSGIECSAGVYFYVLEYKDASGDVKKKNGYISLVR